MTDPVRCNPDFTLLEQAALWFDRMSSAPDMAERSAFEAWRDSSPAHGLAYADIEAGHAASLVLADSNEMLALRHETLSRLVMPRKSRVRPWLSGALAASLLACIGVVGWQYRTVDPPRVAQSAPGISTAQPSGLYQTALGERMSVTLSDGSTVALNTASRLRIAYTSTTRKLILERGQALFEVAKGQPRPFVVIAGDQSITAHGTKFDVRMDANDEIKVALIEGSVSVQRRSSPTVRPTALRPHEILIASATEMLVSPIPEVDRVSSWRDGLIIFENESLRDAVNEMNRYVRQPIIISDERLRTLRISGAFRTGETAAFIEALEVSFPVKVTERTPERIVLSSRN